MRLLLTSVHALVDIASGKFRTLLGSLFLQEPLRLTLKINSIFFCAVYADHSLAHLKFKRNIVYAEIYVKTSFSLLIAPILGYFRLTKLYFYPSWPYKTQEHFLYTRILIEMACRPPAHQSGRGVRMYFWADTLLFNADVSAAITALASSVQIIHFKVIDARPL